MNDQSPDSAGAGYRVWFILLALGLLLGAAGWRLWRPVPAPVPAPPRPEINQTNLTRVGDRWCLRNGTNPFTGYLLEYYPDGTLQSRSAISNGLLEGLSEGWFTNRQLQIRETYHTNFSDGLRTKWYASGKKLSEATVVAGKIEGTFRRWHENGRLAEEIPMVHGKIEGTGRDYYPSGFLKSQVTLHNGNITQSQSWADGEHPGDGN